MGGGQLARREPYWLAAAAAVLLALGGAGDALAAPEITFGAPPPTEHAHGTEYAIPEARCTSSGDDVPVHATTTVNPAALGEYSTTYSCTDLRGETAVRTVPV